MRRVVLAVVAVVGLAVVAPSAELPPQKDYVWYPSNQGPITARAAYTDTPCETIFGFWGAGETIAWDGQSGSCSGEVACWNCANDKAKASVAAGGKRHSTIEILD